MNPRRRQTPSAPLTADQVAFRETRAEDAEGVSRLLYATDGLSYVHGDFYRPQWIAEQIEAGRVLSSVALLGGEVIGHQALLCDQTGAALEIGVAAVHPLYRGMGIDSRLMAHGVERARAMGLHIRLGDDHLPVKPPRSEQGRIKYVRPVRCGNNDHSLICLEPVHFYKELI